MMQMNSQRKSQTWRMNLWLPGGGMREGLSKGVWDGHVHAAMLLRITNQNLLCIAHGTLLSVISAAWMGGDFQENGHMCING